ncbi:hypothetical protein PAXRUDRAFT_832450 [Paxillus rubicundulus Ve08.2h10]|uniref:VWFA domain-containing protein n=1 Tax=Paxillus rubicundulus Ve08.2h10 TaxID=930991 RepID=A0A0D0DR48_9AGAM|nr:hypothetical protein PAXRUDRAFT_832450 [Paxillus rubicundulus Ve08.2h10]
MHTHFHKPPDIIFGDESGHQRGDQLDVPNKGEMNVDGSLSSTSSNSGVSQVAMDTSDPDGSKDISISADDEQARWGTSLEAQPSEGAFHNDDTDSSESESVYTECQTIPPTEIPEVEIEQVDVDIEMASSAHDRLDLVRSIGGMYRILDLIHEEATGGLVEKIIIAQNSLRDFVEAVRPGVYVSLTKVNFKALDQYIVKPIGIYGSKEEIVRFLCSIGRIDEDLAQELLESTSNPTSLKPNLRSGLYVLRHMRRPGDEELFVIYWPEDTTWDDSASSNVSRNRVTFMRYLNKMCDQLMALISPEHARAMVWNTNKEGYISQIGSGYSRLVTFEVSKTNEQEESVVTRPGFQVPSNFIIAPKVPEHCPWDSSQFSPRLLFGETNQGFLTLEYEVAKITSERIKTTYTKLRFQNILKENLVLQINEHLDERGLDILFESELQKRYSDDYHKYKHDVEVIKRKAETDRTTEVSEAVEKLEEDRGSVSKVMRGEAIKMILEKFPILRVEEPGLVQEGDNGDNIATESSSRSKLFALYPDLQKQIKKMWNKPISIRGGDFEKCKKSICFVYELWGQIKGWDKERRDQVINIASNPDLQAAKQALRTECQKDGGGRLKSLVKKGKSLLGSSDHTLVESMIKDAEKSPFHGDVEFVANLDDIQRQLPSLKELVSEAKRALKDEIPKIVSEHCKKLTDMALEVQKTMCASRIKISVETREKEELNESRRGSIRALNASSQSYRSLQRRLIIESVRDAPRKGYYYSGDVSMSGTMEHRKDEGQRYKIHVMGLDTQDHQELLSNPRHIPSPRFRRPHTFCLPPDLVISRAQLLKDDKILLAVTDLQGNLYIYYESLTDINAAVSRRHCKRMDAGKIGENFLLAFDESKRMLCIVATSDLTQLHIFVYDDGRRLMQARGTAISLSKWYREGIFPRHACFICGSEELLLVDTQARARVFSLVTLQFRPAVLDLEQIPASVYSSPDASCFIVSHKYFSGLRLTAYHWSTFGTTDGTPLDVPQLQADDSLCLTSLANKNAVHLLRLDIASQRLEFVALDITRKETEFTFNEKSIRTSATNVTNVTVHNSLIDCHAEVWSQFPVLPAVGRETITSESLRNSKSIVFITDHDHSRYARHFSDLVTTFEHTTKKPGGDILKKISISSAPFSAALYEIQNDAEWNVSKFLAGEWVVNFLCLIPIHIAITKENRFVPLKDGVYSTGHESSLIGADVNRIVDSLSFGWYESIFQSYMATKPVKVVSSMGEQSVGKSFALNHLVDTSFAGSAMRTTEGAWMSVTPTQNALIVALDFEGVHSIERSAQEDTLLVLFNTAISNLVLFRNNFALSRDITGLFQSFQSSSTVLDPGENPNLFNSTLMIIIKDVIDSDMNGIIREFRMKFQKIVQDEQGSNFITRLHRGQLSMLPWPVIASREFYTQFSVVEDMLSRQPTTHKAAGEFLHLMKTLMAKLKANDWGALSQTMASHRAQVLLGLLPKALEYGLQETEPEIEPLKNLDTDETIGVLGTNYPQDPLHRFFLVTGHVDEVSRENMLSVLCQTWVLASPRQHVPDPEWVYGLSQHLETIANMRIEHVREWLDANLSRFQAGHASIEDLHRTFENATVDLKSNVTLCKLQCSSCQLLCIRSRFHQGQHECQTDHSCIHECEYCLDNSAHKGCTMSAGHPGKHICMVDAHLCGQKCKMIGKSGCLGQCIKVVDHPDGGHECAATTHACGEPCALTDIYLADGKRYSCLEKCHIANDLEHDQHRCDARLCSVTCQLCKRLCANTDHMHGLQPGAIHLCGQPHSCEAVCSARGICEIETAPDSIEDIFTGRYETFTYTKFSQVSKRLKCVTVIPPSETQHAGLHTHSHNPKVIHFCEARCDYCGYFCTLPLGHAQQEHETRHGSMSKTRWSIDGPADANLEVEGRRFSCNDTGAPMMCNIVCQAMGRHAHISPCRAPDLAACEGDDQIQHIHRKLHPNPDDAKDFVTHGLFWRRTGFKDPYSKEEQVNFEKCDAMCNGPEHTAAAGNPAQPSYCTLPIFHAPRNPEGPSPAAGYVSHDGHVFSCRNPVSMQPVFHVIFVIDKSGSMAHTDKRPLPDTPASARIIRHSNNRFGAVLSSLYSFLLARDAVMDAGARGTRRDTRSVILFDSEVTEVVFNDVDSSADQLLDTLLRHSTAKGTNFTSAIQTAQDVMQRGWSGERTPVVIFLSDGECRIQNQTVQTLCRSAIQLGKALSFHAISFGRDKQSTTLRRMSQIALEAQCSAPRDPLLPAAATVHSSYSEALDTVQLATTFVGIAQSLNKPRGSLVTDPYYRAPSQSEDPGPRRMRDA